MKFALGSTSARGHKLCARLGCLLAAGAARRRRRLQSANLTWVTDWSRRGGDSRLPEVVRRHPVLCLVRRVLACAASWTPRSPRLSSQGRLLELGSPRPWRPQLERVFGKPNHGSSPGAPVPRPSGRGAGAEVHGSGHDVHMCVGRPGAPGLGWQGHAAFPPALPPPCPRPRPARRAGLGPEAPGARVPGRWQLLHCRKAAPATPRPPSPPARLARLLQGPGRRTPSLRAASTPASSAGCRPTMRPTLRRCPASSSAGTATAGGARRCAAPAGAPPAAP